LDLLLGVDAHERPENSLKDGEADEPLVSNPAVVGFRSGGWEQSSHAVEVGSEQMTLEQCCVEDGLMSLLVSSEKSLERLFDVVSIWSKGGHIEIA